MSKRKNDTSSEVMREKGTKGAIARWGKKAVAEGMLVLGNVSIQCFVLNSKERVIATQPLINAFDMKGGGYKTGDNRLARFAKTEGMVKHVDDELIEQLDNPIEFKALNSNRKKLGYPANALPKLCMAIINAGASNDLKEQQRHIGIQARILMGGLSTVGVISLIDEVTGYQYIRERNALATILEEFIAKEVAVWVKTFPDDFYKEMFRLRRVQSADLHKRPKYFGALTNDIVYSRLAPQIIEELKKKNPKDPEGKRLHTHHQWLTKNKGYVDLRIHLEKLIAYMHVSKDWNSFMKLIDKYIPVQPKVTNEYNIIQQLDNADNCS